jgi:mitofilin
MQTLFRKGLQSKPSGQSQTFWKRTSKEFIGFRFTRQKSSTGATPATSASSLKPPDISGGPRAKLHAAVFSSLAAYFVLAYIFMDDIVDILEENKAKFVKKIEPPQPRKGELSDVAENQMKTDLPNSLATVKDIEGGDKERKDVSSKNLIESNKSMIDVKVDTVKALETTNASDALETANAPEANSLVSGSNLDREEIIETAPIVESSENDKKGSKIEENIETEPQDTLSVQLSGSETENGLDGSETTSYTLLHSEAYENLPTRISLPAVGAESRFEEWKQGLSSSLVDQMTLSIVTRNDKIDELIEDLEGLNENGIRLRITQLAAELFERSKWEKIRLDDRTRRLTEAITSRSEALMKRQRLELEKESNLIISGEEKSLLDALSGDLKQLQNDYEAKGKEEMERCASVNLTNLRDSLELKVAALRKEYDLTFSLKAALIHEENVKHLLSLQRGLESVRSNLHALKVITPDDDSLIPNHRLAASLNLIRGLSGSHPIKEEISTLKGICCDDELLKVLVDSVPVNAIENGIPTVNELASRFKTVRDEVRKLSYAPKDAPFLLGHAVGHLLASLSMQRSGLVTGNGVEEALARAEFHMQQGQLVEALEEVKLPCFDHNANNLMKDWQEDINDRIIVDEISKSLAKHVQLSS